MGELSARMMVSNGNITGLTDRLVEEGLVKRAPSARDRRSSHVSLTPAGKKAFDAMTPEHEQWVDDMMAGLSRQDMQQLFQLLGRLKARSEEHTSELQSLMRNSYAVFRLKKKTQE